MEITDIDLTGEAMQRGKVSRRHLTFVDESTQISKIQMKKNINEIGNILRSKSVSLKLFSEPGFKC